MLALDLRQSMFTLLISHFKKPINSQAKMGRDSRPCPPRKPKRVRKDCHQHEPIPQALNALPSLTGTVLFYPETVVSEVSVCLHEV